MGAFNDVFPFCCYIVIGYPIKFNNGIKFFCQNDSAGHTSESVGEAEGGLHNDDWFGLLPKIFFCIDKYGEYYGNEGHTYNDNVQFHLN